MEIENNILKAYLKNCYFITGTSFSGKSTLCKILSDKFHMIHCKENYNSELIFEIVDWIHQPSLNYFNTKESWESYLNRSPEEFLSWFQSNNKEISQFEVIELIKLSQGQKIIVDTNIPISLLEDITDPHQRVALISDPRYAADHFFDRNDTEKLFLLDEIKSCNNPQKTYNNFIEAMYTINRFYYEQLKSSNIKCIERNHKDWCDEESVLLAVVNHFQF